MTEPTDAEIVALADETRTAEGGASGYILPISFARAVLARWGQPAHSGEPVERDPLTPERVKKIVLDAGYDQCDIPDSERAAFINGLRHGEEAHGIKGGQHD